MNTSLWYKNAVFYEVNVRSFCDSNGDGIGDLKGLTSTLDYFKELGVDCLWLMPFYPSPLNDDGYDIADYYGIHPDLGTLDDLRALISEAHARGLRIITDLVVNHVSDQHPWFQAARSDRNSPYRDYFVWSDTPDKYSQARIIFLDVETSNWAWDETSGQYYWHRFYSSQPDLNYDNPKVQEEMLNVVSYWLDLGLDGFRVDAVPYLFEREGTNCENLPETHAYLKRLRSHIDEHYPGTLLLCEANQWPLDVRPYLGDGDEFHMAFHFPVMPRIYMSVALADRTPIVDILAATPSIPEDCQWCTFLRNHDELTLEMVTLEEREFMWNTYAPEPRMRLNLGIRRRLAPLMDGDLRKILLLNSILFTLPGAPIIYYGDEIGMGDNIWLDDRDGVRTPMQWDDGPGAGFSSAPPEKFYNPLIADDRYGYRRVNAASQKADPNSLWNQIRRMIAIRKEQEAFWSSKYEILPVQDLSILAVLRSGGGSSVIAVHNLSGERREANLDLSRWSDSNPVDLLTGEPYQAESHALPLTLEAYGFYWLKI